MNIKNEVDEQRGSYESFDNDWQEALQTLDPRWFSYPNSNATTQLEMFEYVKAQQINRILQELNLKEGKVLEYGCGSAGMSIYFANEGFKVVAADISINALNVARRNAELHSIDTPQSPTVVCGDTFKLPFPTNTFDVVMSYGLLEHFDAITLPQALSEITRVLKPGGLFLADIIPGPSRVTVRSVSLIVNYLGSVVYHLVTAKFNQIGKLHAAYFEHFYENSYGPNEWEQILSQTDLKQVTVQVCRPFPPLALKGKLENLYVALMKKCLGLWHKFDQMNSVIARRWGWMYLVYGLKSEQQTDQ